MQPRHCTWILWDWEFIGVDVIERQAGDRAEVMVKRTIEMKPCRVSARWEGNEVGRCSQIWRIR